MKTLLKEEKTPTTSKKTFVDENGIESIEYYAYNRKGIMGRCSQCWWALSKAWEIQTQEDNLSEAGER